MGILRTLFAISVVFAHTDLSIFIGGKYAVQLFYMISGFLISYVLVERKVYATNLDFYINRYLRLYPVYFIIAILTLGMHGLRSVTGESINIFKICEQVPTSACTLLMFSNTTIFLQDWLFFLAVKSTDLLFTTSYLKSDSVLVEGLWVPQSWTLGVELTFYFIAPFVLIRKWLMVTLLLGSLTLRGYLIIIGLGTSDPWSYRFFPTELALFLLGSLAHQVALPLYKKTLSSQQLESFSKIATYFLIALTLTYWMIPINFRIKTIALFSIFLVLMPLAFVYQSNRDWDKWIGDLSYPIYICHMFILSIFTLGANWLGLSFDKIELSIGVVILSIGFSIILKSFIEKPIDNLRNRFRSRV
jgi:peptidoglycan/LPS O-acetylase OafA/YrhL